MSKEELNRMPGAVLTRLFSSCILINSSQNDLLSEENATKHRIIRWNFNGSITLTGAAYSCNCCHQKDNIKGGQNPRKILE